MITARRTLTLAASLTLVLTLGGCDGVPNVTAGDYFLLIANFADEDESLSLQVGHTTGGGAAAALASREPSKDDAIRPRAVKALVRNR